MSTQTSTLGKELRPSQSSSMDIVMTQSNKFLVMSSDLKCPMNVKEKISHGEISSSFSESLTSLNAAVLVWIKQEVDKNPTVILVPIFKFYEQKLQEIQEKLPSSSEQLISATINQEEYQTNQSEAKEETPGSKIDSIKSRSSTLEIS